MIDRTLSHYKIIAKIGEGGMGEVYLAEDLSIHRKVALKFLSTRYTFDPEARKRFEREAQAAGSINHPSIVTIYEINQSGEQTYIAMEYVEGEHLRRKIAAAAEASQASGHPGLAIAEALDYSVQICRGLQQAHEAGVVHRDLKPENILIDKAGRLKILDFGLAKLKGTTRLTQDHSVLGTVYYISPEQAMCRAVDARSDIWSFGVLVYEMLAGTPPFVGEHDQAVIYAVIHLGPKPLAEVRRDVPLTLQRVVEGCLQKNPDDRPQTAALVQAELERLQQGIDEPRIPVPKSKGAGIEPKHRPWAKVIAAVLAGVLILAILAGYRRIGNFLGASGLPDEKHLLVLPFTNVGGEKGSQAFCDGLVETLTSQLTRFEKTGGDFWVIPATEVRKNGVTSIAEAQKSYGVNLVITGSVQRMEDEVRLTMNLVDAKKLRQLRSVVVTKRLLALGDFQDEVVARLAEMLGVKVPTKAGDMLTAGTTKNSEAYADYTQARGFLLDYAKAESLESAIRLFQSAVDKDPQYALAYAGLGEAYWRKHENSKDPQWADDAIENCRRAIRINDHLIPVRVTLGMIYAGTGKNGDAIRELQQVLETDPGNSDALRELADAYGTAGKLKEAEDMYRSVIRLKPNYWLGYHRLGTFYFQQGRYPEAARAFQEVITLAPDNAKAYSNLGGMYYLMERPDEAVKMYERSIEIKPTYGGYMNLGTLNFQEKRFKNAARAYEEALKLNDKEYRIWKFLAACYGQIPDERQKLEEAEKRALELEEALLKINPEDPMLLAQLTMSYVEFHQPEKAAECLEKAVSLKPTSGDVLYQIAEGYEALGKRDDALTYLEEAIKRGFPSLNNLKNSSTPVLQSLRKDPRFSELLRRVEKNNPQP